MNKAKLVSFIFLLGLSFNASALITGNDLYKHCTSTEIGFTGYCMGYIQSAAEVAPNYARSVGGKPDICIHPDATTTQMVNIFKKRMEMFPESGHKPASLIVSVALSIAFSCE